MAPIKAYYAYFLQQDLLSFAWHSSYTYEIFDFTQYCTYPGLMHSNNAWDSVHAFCSNHALPGQLATALTCHSSEILDTAVTNASAVKARDSDY